MAETKQYTFDLRDAAIALIKSHKIHSGVWQIGFEFTLGAGNIGPSVEATRPSAFVQITKLLLTRHEENAPVFGYVVDAAEVNPAEPQRKTAKTR
jgi:hypothetical protein